MMMVVLFRVVRTVSGGTITSIMPIWICLNLVVVDFCIAAAWSRRRPHVVLTIAIGGHGLAISCHILLRIRALLTWRCRVVLFGGLVALLPRVWLHVWNRTAWRSAGRRVWHGPSIT